MPTLPLAVIERLAPRHAALQQGRTPRPLPLFLQLVREVAASDPMLAQRALEGLTRYQREPRPVAPAPRAALTQVQGAVIRNHGGSGRPLVLIPSLINPTSVLDFPGRSLAKALTRTNRVVLVDWGPASRRASLDLGGHVTDLLVPLLDALGEPVDLVGYCVGGTMALAAAGLANVGRVATLAAPWRFDAYPKESLIGLDRMWRGAEPASSRIGLLPIEVLQAAFWSLDPHGVVAKFAALADEPAESPVATRFVMLEDWANGGEALPLPAARELIETLFLANASGNGQWRVGDVVIDPSARRAIHFTAAGDRIVPAASAPPGHLHAIRSGHVGMIVGSRAPLLLHQPLRAFLAEER